MTIRTFTMTIGDIDGDVTESADELAVRLERDLNHGTDHERVEVSIEEIEHG